jgi:PAS domain S-box-containing protein
VISGCGLDPDGSLAQKTLLDAFIILTFFVAIIARLKAVETRFAAFMKYIPGAAFLKKSSGQFVYVNETWERASQVKGKDIYGKCDHDLWPEDIAAQYKTNDKTVIEAKIPLQFMQPVPQDDGLHSWYTIKFPILDDTGSVVMLGGIAIDVTEREHIELKVIPAERDIMVMADSNQIEQILVNLLTNARDAMPDGGRLTIRTGIMEMNDEFIKGHGYGIPGKYAVLTVTDTGTGMEEGVREKIFQPFFTTKMVGKGSGLGLAVTYGIVKQHNGFIDADSVPKEGTTFTIYLPAVDAEAIHYQEGRDLSAVNSGVETILLAEDDPDTRAIMSALLEMTGYNVLVAGDGEDAMKVVTENGARIQLVLLDVRMPRKNGREVYDEIRKVRPAMKFLFMSGYTADIIASYGIKEEGLNFISKTALPEEILTKIREIFDKQEKE